MDRITSTGDHMDKTKIMDLTTACHSFPKLPIPEIDRETSLDTIKRLFSKGNEVVVVEGEEGIGKTVLLALFAKRYPNRTFSLFIKSSRLGHDPQILRYDLCNQLEWALNKAELNTIHEASDAFLRDRLMSLHKLTRKEPLYFVVDDLCKAPKTILRFVIDMLPMNFSGFHFLLSGNIEELSPHLVKDIRVKPHLLASFSLAQTRKYFENLEVTPNLIEELRLSCRKIPGYLASARRSIEAGVDIRTILEESNWFEVEWRKVNPDDDDQLIILAIIAYTQTLYSISDLARLLEITKEKVFELIEELSFITIKEDLSVNFVSESFRKYAKNKLENLKNEVGNYVINDLLKDPSSRRSLMHLPVWLREAGRLDQLLEYLSPENFVNLLSYNQSLVPVKQKADIGINTARELGRDGDLLRFSLQKSAMNEIGGAEVWRSEIQARMALNDYDSALALAQSTVLKEDRLHLLAVIARAKREQGLEPEIELQEQIRQLYKQIDLTSLGDQAIEIAVDLVYSNPELAIDIIEKSGNVDTEWALAKLSANTIETNDESLKAIEDIRRRIGDSKAERFSIESALMLENCPSQTVIDEIEKVKKKDKLYLLCQWITKNRERDDAYEVVEYTFDLVMGMSPDEYVPARTFRQMAAPLPFIKDKAKAKQLVKNFDGQLGLIERMGPTEDYIRLQLLISQTESNYHFDLAKDRILDIYKYITDLKDLIIRAVCLARLATTLPSIDPQKDLEEIYNLHSLTESHLDRDITQLLSVTAEQYQATRGVIRALTRSRPDLAYELGVDTLSYYP